MQYMMMLLFLTMTTVASAIDVSYSIDSARSDELGRFIIIVGDVPRHEEGKNTRAVMIERILHGPNVEIGTVVPVKFNPARPQLDEGKYLLLLMYDNDTLVWGYGSVRIGPIIDMYQVKTANDPEVSDVQLMIDTATIRVPGLKYQRLQEIVVRMSHRPLVLQYALEAQVTIRNDIVQKTDGLLWYVLSHPENHPSSTLILADQLLVGTEVMNATTNQGPRWSTSNNRTILFELMRENLPQNDHALRYIENVLRFLHRLNDPASKAEK